MKLNKICLILILTNSAVITAAGGILLFLFMQNHGSILIREKAPWTVGNVAVQPDLIILGLGLGLVLFSVVLYRQVTKETQISRRGDDDPKSGEESPSSFSRLHTLFNLVEKAKQEWEGALDCIDDMIIVVSPEGLIKRMNRPFRKFASAPYTDLIGKDWKTVFSDYGLVDDDTLPIGVPLRKWHAESGSSFIISRFELESDEPGGDPGSVVIVRDETDLYQTMKDLDSCNLEIDLNRKQLQNALDELSLIIQRVAEEEDFGVRVVSSRIRKIPEDESSGRNECSDHELKSIADLETVEVARKAYSGKMGTLVASESFHPGPQDPIFLIGEKFNNMMDILEAKNSELHKAYEDLKHAHFQILQQEKMASVGQLAAGVAHEINNPMGFIGSNLASLGRYCAKMTEYIEIQGKLLAEFSTPEALNELEVVRKKLRLDFVIPDIQDLISESLNGADRVRQIVMDLKNFSRADQAEQQLANINECLDSSLSIVWNEIKYKATVEKLYGDIPQIMCYPQQLSQVFVNLIVNGAQAIDDQGVITLKTEENDGFVHVSVSDTGCGISPENQKKIFEPFYTTKGVGKGTGLGMSIAYDIVKKHGGSIVIKSETGKGSTFIVRLPID